MSLDSNKMEEVYNATTELAEALPEIRAEIGQELMELGEAMDEMAVIMYGPEILDEEE